MIKVVAIHQPNFFPWLGYFDKIRRSDIFILLDDVQFSKTGGVWSNRVKVLINGEGRWLTAPVERNFHGTRNVNQMYFSNQDDWRGKVVKTLASAYKRAPYFDETYSFISPLILNPENNVAEYNIYAIKSLAVAFGYPINSIFRSSDLATESTATERLVALTTKVGGQAYLCGGGAAGYQEDEIFHKAGLNLLYQNFINPSYFQFNTQEFVGGLSLVDALMNVGFNGVKELLRQDTQ
jgi:hypothetical protein